MTEHDIISLMAAQILAGKIARLSNPSTMVPEDKVIVANAVRLALDVRAEAAAQTRGRAERLAGPAALLQGAELVGPTAPLRVAEKCHGCGKPVTAALQPTGTYYALCLQCGTGNVYQAPPPPAPAPPERCQVCGHPIEVDDHEGWETGVHERCDRRAVDGGRRRSAVGPILPNRRKAHRRAVDQAAPSYDHPHNTARD